ncbi:MAG: hypothetical protein FD157_964 [Rhodocyclaceae bacterium]|nr:MAG: hypothetical protein FD157_964 [Rhodocyclaceae bacterium]TND05989.1 MAG: hypothetical protein FD118_61 [Rhodocyclaceae bacterium]
MQSKSFRSTFIATSAMFLAVGGPAMLAAEAAHAEVAQPESAGELLDDAVLTTKVKLAFFQDEKVSTLRINVTSNAGVVQLSGFANSAEEAERAEELARKVPGVMSVKNDILLKKALR